MASFLMRAAAPFVIATCLATTLRAQTTSGNDAARGAGSTDVVLDQLSVEGAAGGPSEPQGGVTVGYLTKQTRSATKTDTPLIDTPQSVTVVTQQQVRDQNFQSIEDALRYVPGVIPQLGEGNRDELVIRGQRSNADFYVNGVRDDIPYYRDLYNIQRIEVLKGPNALIFGRGGGGGLVNRVLKEADGVPLREVVVSGGQFNNKRLAGDIGDRVSDAVFFRMNGVIEASDTYRDFVDVRRYGVNPTLTFLIDPATTLKLSYEYFHDDRVIDRGIPSQFGRAFLYRRNVSTFYGDRSANLSVADVNVATAILDHAFDSSVQLHSQLRFADYRKSYTNVFASGPVNAGSTAVPVLAFDNKTDRTNYFSQNDFTYKFDTGPLKHTVLAGFELGYQDGLALIGARPGLFPNGSMTLQVNPFFPTTNLPIRYVNVPGGINSRYDLGLAAVYAQDQIEINEHVQLIGGLRYDHFDLSATDRRTFVSGSRTDDLLSPRAGIVLKPIGNMSFYGSYSVSYIPSVGDQLTQLTPGLTTAPPEKFENAEVGFKYDVTPGFEITGAAYNLDRTNQRLNDPNRPDSFLSTGKTGTQGFEIGINGAITDWWQAAGGFAFTDASIVSGFSNGATSIRPGNRVGLVPFNALTIWNKFDVTPELSFGIGYIQTGHTFATSDDTIRLPGITRFDLGLFYKINDAVRAQVNIENVFDRRYIATAEANNNILPGAPRTVRVQIIARF